MPWGTVLNVETKGQLALNAALISYSSIISMPWGMVLNVETKG